MHTSTVAAMEVGYHLRPSTHVVRMESRASAISDGCGNLTANHPAIRAGIERDSKKFREITDLRSRGII